MKKGKKVKKIASKLEKQFQTNLQKQNKKKVLSELKSNVKAIKIKEQLKKTIIPKDTQNKIMFAAYQDFFNKKKMIDLIK